MTETSKAKARREKEGWYTKYLVGYGVDIGAGRDPILPAAQCLAWDIPNGDAQTLPGAKDGTFNWVYSSHCLEHMRNPRIALQNWWRVLKPGGYLLVSVPDEDLYEQGAWPSKMNVDHKTTWTIHKDQSWSPVSMNLKDEIEKLPGAEIESIKRVDTDYNYDLENWVGLLGLIPANVAIDFHKSNGATGLGGEIRFIEFQLIDQTNLFNAEASIEVVAKKVI